MAYCKKETQPLQAKLGFAVGSGCKCTENTQLLNDYRNCQDWYPTVDGLVNNIGSKWWKVGDQVFLNINLQFVAASATDQFLIEQLPLIMDSNTFVANGVSLVDGVATPEVLVENSVLETNTSDYTSLYLKTGTALTAGNLYTLNAQIIYNPS